MFGWQIQLPGFWLQTAVAAVAFAVALLLVLTQRWHGHFTLDSDHGVQKFHTAPTPRVGGLAVVMALLLGNHLAPADLRALLEPLLLAAMPAFGFGIAEDLTKRVSVGLRLWATIGSGVLVWLQTGIVLQHVDIAPFDFALQWLPLAVVVTALAIGGIANAVNMIDGFNGLAGGSLVFMFGALGLVAQQAGDPALAGLCFMFVAAGVGFLVLNFPAGKIFLGDGGAYFGGFALAWLAILLPARNPEVSPWASLLICTYPVLEVVFSILRRRHRRSHPGAPDRLHLHSLVHARVVRHFISAAHPTLRNAAVSPLMWLLTLAPGCLVQLSWYSRALCLLGVVFVCSAYLMCYVRLVRFRWPCTSSAIELHRT